MFTLLRNIDNKKIDGWRREATVRGKDTGVKQRGRGQLPIVGYWPGR